MPIVLPFPITIQEMRVLQEFRRLAADTLPVASIKAVKHPSGGGDAPAISLIDKGYLTADDGRQNFTLTEKAKEFLAIDAKPLVEEGPGGGEEAVVE